MSQLIVSTKIHFGRGRRAQKELRSELKSASGSESDAIRTSASQPDVPVPVPVPAPAPARLHRITKLMALAIRFEGLVRESAVRDYADLARLGRVSRAR